MKRSDMVSIFDLSYGAWGHDPSVYKRFDSYGDYLVHLAVEAGMLPPVKSHKLPHAYLRFVEHCKWEKENE